VSWGVFKINDDGRRETIAVRMGDQDAERVAGKMRAAMTDDEVAAGWNYVAARDGMHSRRAQADVSALREAVKIADEMADKRQAEGRTAESFGARSVANALIRMCAKSGRQDMTRCCAWKDGKHCFEVGTTWPDRGAGQERTPQHAGYGKKGCKCGAVVESTKAPMCRSRDRETGQRCQLPAGHYPPYHDTKPKT
jgi:hypothetical protein